MKLEVVRGNGWFDKLTTNGGAPRAEGSTAGGGPTKDGGGASNLGVCFHPFVLSPSKDGPQ